MSKKMNFKHIAIILLFIIVSSEGCKARDKRGPSAVNDANQLEPSSLGQDKQVEGDLYVVDASQNSLRILGSAPKRDISDWVSVLIPAKSSGGDRHLTQYADSNGYIRLLVAKNQIDFYKDQRVPDQALALGGLPMFKDAPLDLEAKADVAHMPRTPLRDTPSVVRTRPPLPEHALLMPQRPLVNLSDSGPPSMSAPGVKQARAIKSTNVNDGLVNLRTQNAVLSASPLTAVGLDLAGAKATHIRVIPEDEHFIVEQLHKQISSVGLQATLKVRPEFGPLLLDHKVVSADMLESLPLHSLDQGLHLQDIPLSKQESVAAPYIERARLHFAMTGKKTVVLGHLSETHASVWGGKDYVTVLNIPDWTLEKNMAWLEENAVLKDGAEILIVSRPREYDGLQQHEPVFHLELRALINAGFVRVGNYMVKTPINKYFAAPSVQRIDGVCIVPACYPPPHR